jgi:TolB-like protein/DNA-binding winged helix-turn-helix (wHTH) protein/Flp pilus assembly protein TadD
MTRPASREALRFREFELDVAAYELRRRGRPVRLERRPMDLLILLVERRGLLVTRAEIVDRLWGQDVFVDVETGVHTAIRKIRQALHDSADAPVFIETVSGKGYRFSAEVEVVSTASVHEPAEPPDDKPDEPPRPAEPPPAPRPAAPPPRRNFLPVAAAAALLLVAGMAWVLSRGDAPPSRVALAVLPFENLGSDPEREYLAAGLTEETGASLAQVDPERLIVKGRTLRYRGTQKSAAEIGRELAVDYLVESSVRAEGSRLRITTRLIRVRDQEHVWSQSYEREPTSLLGLEEELSSAIAEQVHLRVLPDSPGRLAHRQSQNAEAYDAYLRGRHFERRRTPETNALAVRQYERAIALDPAYALAWAHLSLTYAGSTQNGDARPSDVTARAREAAEQAIRANAQLSEAQLAMGYVHWIVDWDWPAAEASLRRAVALDPSNAAAHRTLGHALSQMRRDVEAKAAMLRARELEPLEPVSFALSSQVAYQAGDFADAIEFARRAVRLDAEFWIGYIQLAQAYGQVGSGDLALEALTDATRLSGGNSKTISLRGYLLGSMGRAPEAREVLTVLEAEARRRYLPPYAIALVHAGLGERTAALDWLDKAFVERDVHLIFLPVDPKWDPFRGDPRFVELLRRCAFDGPSG